MSDREFMIYALNLAKRMEGFTSPNPSVGAVVVKNGKILSKGVHRGPGTLHAEVDALKKARAKARGATLYVTLEPCNHYGRTPPCTLEIIESNIKKVVYGVKDPNPDVTGKGAEFLSSRGIKVLKLDPSGKIEEFYKPYFKFVVSKMPFVTLKLSLTLDSKLTLKRGEKHILSSPEALKFAHRLRMQSDAVLIGSKTLNIDDPLLTVRGIRGEGTKLLTRIILDGNLCVKASSKIFNTLDKGKVIFFTCNDTKKNKVEKIRQKGVEVIQVKSRDGMVDVEKVLKITGEMGIMNLLVEGGSRVSKSFIEKKLVDRFILIYSPIIAGRNAKSFGDLIDRTSKRFNLKEVKKYGDSVVLRLEV